MRIPPNSILEMPCAWRHMLQGHAAFNAFMVIGRPRILIWLCSNMVPPVWKIEILKAAAALAQNLQADLSEIGSSFAILNHWYGLFCFQDFLQHEKSLDIHSNASLLNVPPKEETNDHNLES
ncbi:hypothetical protein NC651_034986 [Populus alba x Populus x berolinensis]|nr:hypothetical protein NC651_034986 [Populus alba x Populus x berolinensis]